jgi:hypothetical protein
MPWRNGMWLPPRNSYLGCTVCPGDGSYYCDPNPVYSDCCQPTSTSTGTTAPAADANSTAAGGSLPATGAPATTATGAPASTTPAAASGTSSFSMSNFTNFSTPYPYVAIGGAILLVALLTGGGRSRGGSAPPIIHYG